MGYYVHFQVSWNNGSVEDLKPIAEKYLKLVNDEMYLERELRFFFESVASGKSYFHGRKGDFWAFGTIGNYLQPENFIKSVMPFFKECYEKNYIFDFERVLFMCEPEQSESVDIYQLRPVRESNDSPLVVEKFSSKHEWYWGQM